MDPFIESLKKNEELMKTLTVEQRMALALSELLMESATGADVPPGTKAKRIALSAVLTQDAGVKW
jgi:hypothetical protein